MKREDIVKTINSLKGEAGHKKVLEVYNAQKPLPRGYKVKPTDAWCATTVSAVFLMNGYSDISECSCPKMIEKAQKLGIWVEDDAYVPKAGDVIMYDWQDSGKGDDKGVADHVGVVIKVDKRKVMVREGNKNKTIGNRDITVDGIHIRGYITPKFTEESLSEAKEEPKKTDPGSKPAPPAETKESQKKAQETYIPGRVYTVVVKTALNVRKGPGKNYSLVGYKNLTADGKKHAYANGALKNNTKVTVQQVEIIDYNNIWVRIPSGWICAVDNGRVLVK